jgi:hypothetical protein
VLEKLNTLVPPPIVTGIFLLAMWATRKTNTKMESEFIWSGSKLAALGVLSLGLLLMSIATLQFIKAKTTVNPMRPAGTSTI